MKPTWHVGFTIESEDGQPGIWREELYSTAVFTGVYVNPDTGIRIRFKPPIDGIDTHQGVTSTGLCQRGE